MYRTITSLMDTSKGTTYSWFKESYYKNQAIRYLKERNKFGDVLVRYHDNPGYFIINYTGLKNIPKPSNYGCIGCTNDNEYIYTGKDNKTFKICRLLIYDLVVSLKGYKFVLHKPDKFNSFNSLLFKLLENKELEYSYLCNIVKKIKSVYHILNKKNINDKDINLNKISITPKLSPSESQLDLLPNNIDESVEISQNFNLNLNNSKNDKKNKKEKENENENENKNENSESNFESDSNSELNNFSTTKIQESRKKILQNNKLYVDIDYTDAFTPYRKRLGKQPTENDLYNINLHHFLKNKPDINKDSDSI